MSHNPSAYSSRVTMIETGGHRLINAMIKSLSVPSSRNSHGTGNLLFLRGLDDRVRNNKREFINKVRKIYRGVRHVHVERKFGRIYFHNKEQCEAAICYSSEFFFRGACIMLYRPGHSNDRRTWRSQQGRSFSTFTNRGPSLNENHSASLDSSEVRLNEDHSASLDSPKVCLNEDHSASLDGSEVRLNESPVDSQASSDFESVPVDINDVNVPEEKKKGFFSFFSFSR